MRYDATRLGRGFAAAAVLAAGLWGHQSWSGATGSTLFAQPACVAVRNGKPVTGNSDALARLLAASQSCPRDAVALRTQILDRGGKIATAFINNRGFHNPSRGSFSLFEIVTGELKSAGVVEDGQFFFGHFVEPAGSQLTLSQTPGNGALMVEAIAWDPAKGLFNFYELRGTGSSGRWDYNGDSADVLRDTAPLHRLRNPGQPSITGTLRCSSCHVNGGPIMKELAAPHNDWWATDRRPDLGGRQFDNQLAAISAGFVDGTRLSGSVRAGLTRLNASPQFRAAVASHTLQEQLRPLFCPVELNFESDPAPLDGKNATTRLPSALWVDPRLAQGALDASRADYDAALTATGSQFPETQRADADHAWLGPVKATSDQMAIASLVTSKLIDDEFVADVLAVDFTNPVLSSQRCNLLRLVPTATAPDWRDRFRQALSAAKDAAAKDLATNLTETTRTAAFHQQRATQFLASCREKLKARTFVISALQLVQQTRAAVRRNEISQGAGGQILEPGFRVIFPVAKPRDGELRLSQECEIATGAL